MSNDLEDAILKSIDGYLADLKKEMNSFYGDTPSSMSDILKGHIAAARWCRSLIVDTVRKFK